MRFSLFLFRHSFGFFGLWAVLFSCYQLSITKYHHIYFHFVWQTTTRDCASNSFSESSELPRRFWLLESSFLHLALSLVRARFIFVDIFIPHSSDHAEASQRSEHFFFLSLFRFGKSFVFEITSKILENTEDGTKKLKIYDALKETNMRMIIYSVFTFPFALYQSIILAFTVSMTVSIEFRSTKNNEREKKMKQKKKSWRVQIGQRNLT